MTRLDRAFIAWTQGNFVGTFPPSVVFTKQAVFSDGCMVYSRIKDFSNKAFIIKICDTPHDLRQKPVSRQILLKDSQSAKLHGRMHVIASALERCRRDWWNIKAADLDQVGRSISQIRELVNGFYITDLQDEDSVLLGAKFLLTGRAGAITKKPKDSLFGAYDYVIHRSLDEGILSKMSKSDILLYDLT